MFVHTDTRLELWIGCVGVHPRGVHVGRNVADRDVHRQRRRGVGDVLERRPIDAGRIDAERQLETIGARGDRQLRDPDAGKPQIQKRLLDVRGRGVQIGVVERDRRRGQRADLQLERTGERRARGRELQYLGVLVVGGDERPNADRREAGRKHAGRRLRRARLDRREVERSPRNAQLHFKPAWTGRPTGNQRDFRCIDALLRGCIVAERQQRVADIVRHLFQVRPIEGDRVRVFGSAGQRIMDMELEGEGSADAGIECKDLHRVGRDLARYVHRVGHHADG